MNDSAYSTSSADATVGISTIPSSDSGEVTELFSKDIDDMVEMVAHWMKKKEELVEELIHLNDNVLVTNIHDPDGEVEKIVEKYLPKKVSP
ncbi:hypothetical protein QR680_007980 [Steinernema hermaphroditum]|uniref:Uncharacterized protein n=1 Tax=Steinernema hermaphroditum TaxID=289476 RepID=A0AA39IH29_9BILA|nr:hypothetical protein QR680_007980 [Steinernema hermaphroditum]